MEKYETRIVECNVELTGKQKLMLMETSDAIMLNDVDNGFTLAPDIIAKIAVHNEYSENTDYDVYVIIDKDGNKYTTSSNSFWTSLKAIMDAMSDSDEAYSVKVVKVQSKNNTGKILTCAIV